MTCDTNESHMKSGEQSADNRDNHNMFGFKKYIYVFHKIWLLLVNIMITYFITYSLFPSLQANIKPLNHIIDDKYFTIRSSRCKVTITNSSESDETKV